MKKRLCTLSVLASSILLLCSACLEEPERLNPLDEKSEDFVDAGSISGTTLTYYSPFQPLNAVSLQLEPGGFTTTSGPDGRFEFTGVPSNSYVLRASQTGYGHIPDSVEVRIAETAEIELHLDGLPFITAPTVVSCHLARTFPLEDLYILELTAEIDDLDGLNDIDLVALDIPAISFADSSNDSQTPGSYLRRLHASDLPVNNLHELIGRPIIINASDRVGFSANSEPVLLTRVIEEKPQTESPRDFAPLNDTTPELRWRSVSLPFNFTFRVEVLSVDFGVMLEVWSRPGISKDSTSVSVDEVLAPGAYNWLVSIVDEFGNWSRSEAASFQIN